MYVPYTNFPQQFELEKGEMIEAFVDVMAKGDFILGAAVEEFENEFKKISGAKHAIGVANGTDSLILALRLMGIGPGDEVITAPNSWVSSASSIALVGARPVFVDVGPDQNLDPDKIEAHLTLRTRAIMPVHLTGRMADMRAIQEIADRHALTVIEDAAQAVGARRDGLNAGACGDIGSFSLHPLKNLNAAGDAGVLTTNDDEIAAELRLLRNHGLRTRDVIEYWGFNSRLDTLQAAILLPRVRRLNALIERRRAIAKKYAAQLPITVLCPFERVGEFHTYHVYVVQCEMRDQLQAFLTERGIETKIHYPTPIHLQPAARPYGYRRGDFPNCEYQASRILSLPINQYLTDQQIDYVCDSIRTFYAH